MSAHTATNQPEFSRIVVVEKIPASGLQQKIQAKESEREELAARFGLIELKNLEAELVVYPMRVDQTVNVTGTLAADVVQQCVVTLEPLPQKVEHAFKVIFAVSGEAETLAGPSDMNEDDWEPIVNGSIDIGELVAQNLGLALDPYPRKPGVGFVEATYGDVKSEPSPLAQLANWPKKPKDSA